MKSDIFKKSVLSTILCLGLANATDSAQDPLAAPAPAPTFRNGSPEFQVNEFQAALDAGTVDHATAVHLLEGALPADINDARLTVPLLTIALSQHFSTDDAIINRVTDLLGSYVTSRYDWFKDTHVAPGDIRLVGLASQQLKSEEDQAKIRQLLSFGLDAVSHQLSSLDPMVYASGCDTLSYFLNEFDNSHLRNRAMAYLTQEIAAIVNYQAPARAATLRLALETPACLAKVMAECFLINYNPDNPFTAESTPVIEKLTGELQLAEANAVASDA